MIRMLVFPRSKETSRSNFLLHDPVEPSHKPCDLVGLDYIPTDLQKTGPPGQSTLTQVLQSVSPVGLRCVSHLGLTHLVHTASLQIEDKLDGSHEKVIS